MFINLARVKHVVLGAIIADGLYYLTGLLWPISMGSTANENSSCHDSNQLRLCLILWNNSNLYPARVMVSLQLFILISGR